MADNITKREYFTAMAMQGMIDSHSVFSVLSNNGKTAPEEVCKAFGEHCVVMADAVIAALDAHIEREAQEGEK